MALAAARRKQQKFIGFEYFSNKTTVVGQGLAPAVQVCEILEAGASPRPTLMQHPDKLQFTIIYFSVSFQSPSLQCSIIGTVIEFMKILIIEDEKMLADSLKMLLEHKGFEVETVYDGEDGEQ